MWPAIGAIGGALIGALSSRSANKANEANQEEFAKHGISWKVADAKAAGLHPLFALGGSGAAYTPSAQPLMTAGEGASLGQNLARAAVGTSEFDRNMQALQLEAAKAAISKDQALAAAANSEAARNAQAMNQSKPLVGIPFEAGLNQFMRGMENERMFDGVAAGVRPSDALPIGGVKLKPSEQVARRAGSPHMEASDNPFWQEYEIAPGFRSLLPRSSDPSESLENLSIWNLPAVYEVNRKKYGDAWAKKFIEHVYGVRIPGPTEQLNKNLPEHLRTLRGLYDRLPGRFR